MLFNSYAYILGFLPFSIILYWYTRRKLGLRVANAILSVTSLLFYGYYDYRQVPLIFGSIAFNYFIGELIHRNLGPKRLVLWTGIIGDIILLGLFKYIDFLFSNIGGLFHYNLPQLHWTLPLGISFFTFAQIGYLVDTYRGYAGKRNVANYSLFVLFFPHLISGPISRHSELMPQFTDSNTRMLPWKNTALGIQIFAIGLFKKVVIADTLAEWATSGFAVQNLHLIAAWFASLSYTFQIYFDFSGYADMAIGSALFFNIRLPENFDSPYKSLGIQEFWKRWHMTLSRWMKEYIYIPLGGSRRNQLVLARNLMLTFLLVGLWHGAGWTFLVWGALHGSALLVERIWKQIGFRMPHALAWLVTFLFINCTWVFFRAPTMQQALDLLSSMIGKNGVSLPIDTITWSGLVAGSAWSSWLAGIKGSVYTVIVLSVSFWVIISAPNTHDLSNVPTLSGALLTSCLVVISLLSLHGVSNFIYFAF